MSANEKDVQDTNDMSKETIIEIEKKLNEIKTGELETKEKEKNSEYKNLVNESKENKIKNKNTWVGIAFFTTFLAILLFSTVFSLLNIGKTTIARGVSIKGIDVSNLTVEEATKKINEVVNLELMLGIDLKYEDKYKVEFDINQIQYEYDVSKAIKEAYKVGKDENMIFNNYTLLLTAFMGKNIELQGKYNEDSLNGIIDDIASKVPGLVVQASYYIEGNQLIIDKGMNGIIVKKEELKKDILENIKNRNAIDIMENNEKQIIKIQVENVNPDPIDIEQIYEEIHCEPKDAYYIKEPFQLFPEKDGVDFAINITEAKSIIADENKEEYIIPLTLTPAQKTINDIGTEAFPYLISKFTTKYDASNRDRSTNLKIASDKINGTVLMPGEIFSFNETVGKRTIQEGYKNAKIYENGQVVDGLAGGICQISSTLYNSVLMANLEIIERRNHSFTSTYVPAGRDATVVYGITDFKFKNTRNYPIKIEGNVSNGIVDFKIHGIKEEIEYDIKIIPVTTQTIPYQTEYIPDSLLAPGQQNVVQNGHSGYKVTTYIEKRLGGAVISKDILSNDTYKPMKTIVHVGQ